jgi:hypothetical protein
MPQFATRLPSPGTQMSSDKRAVLKQWLASGKASLQPLTFPQRELWETSPVPVQDMANHICCVINVRGVMTHSSCESALQRVVDRQEVLRLSFLPAKERPVQLIRQSAEADLRFRELAAHECDDRAVDELAGEIFAEPFDLLQGPLYRATLFRRGPEDHILAFAIHHSIADGWTLGVFVQDLCLAYVQGLMGLSEALPPVALTYSAWGAAEREYWTPAEIEKRATFWRPLLAGAPRHWNALEGPATASGPHHRWVTHLPAAMAEAAHDLARISGATLYSTLLAVFQVALSHWSGEPDTLVGTPIANRSAQTVRETMGYFATIVPVRVHVDSRRQFADNLREVHQTTVECFANAIPFVELAGVLGDEAQLGHNPLFEVRFALQNHPVPDVSLHGLSAKLQMRSTGTARFHLGCEITIIPTGLELVWLFRPNLFPKAEIENLARIFNIALESASRSPESRITSLVN